MKKKKLKILFVTQNWNTNCHHSRYGGYQRLVYHMPTDLIKPTVLTWGEETKYFEDNGIPVIVLKIPKFLRFLFKRFVLSRYASKESSKFDLVHALYEDVAPLRSKCPLIATFHIHKDLDRGSKFLKIKYYLQNIVLKKSDRVIVLSKNMKEILSKHAEEEKITVIPHGIDTKHFTPIDIPKELIDIKRNFKGVILCIGDCGTKKEEILRVASFLQEYLFILIGKSWQVERNNIIIYYERVSEQKLSELYSMADFLYRPMQFSSANNSILEAISMGLFVITNETEGVLDYLDEDNSIIADDFADNPHFYLPQNIDKGNIINKAKKFDWDVIVAELIKEYSNMLDDIQDSKGNTI